MLRARVVGEAPAGPVPGGAKNLPENLLPHLLQGRGPEGTEPAGCAGQHRAPSSEHPGGCFQVWGLQMGGGPDGRWQVTELRVPDAGPGPESGCVTC